jgi:hypothetical protein
MESEEELRKRIEELEKGLAQAKWQADYEAQKVRDKANLDELRKEDKKENNTFLIFAALCALPFIIAWLK